jgi:hypothetical protein
MPRGFRTEDGPRPEFGRIYGAVETPSGEYAERTRANVRDSEATLWFGDPESTGGRTTLQACEALRRPCLLVDDGRHGAPDIARWILAKEIRILNVAGNRESTTPGIGKITHIMLMKIFINYFEICKLLDSAAR